MCYFLVGSAMASLTRSVTRNFQPFTTCRDPRLRRCWQRDEDARRQGRLSNIISHCRTTTCTSENFLFPFSRDLRGDTLYAPVWSEVGERSGSCHECCKFGANPRTQNHRAFHHVGRYSGTG